MSEEQEYRMRLSSRDTPYQSSSSTNNTTATELEALAESLKEAVSKRSSSSSPTRSRRTGRSQDSPTRSQRRSPSRQPPRSPRRQSPKSTNDTAVGNKNQSLRAWQRSAESAGGRRNSKSEKRLSSTSPPVQHGRVDKYASQRDFKSSSRGGRGNDTQSHHNQQQNQNFSKGAYGNRFNDTQSYHHQQRRDQTRPDGAYGNRFNDTQSHHHHQQNQQSHHHQQNRTRPNGARGTRITDKHILFWGGPLSNWNVGVPFSGRRAMNLLIERLDKAGITSHPSPTALATELMARHVFACGEQFMMAAKGWLFERMIPGGEKDTRDMSGVEIDGLCKNILHPQPQSQDKTHGYATASQNGVHGYATASQNNVRGLATAQDKTHNTATAAQEHERHTTPQDETHTTSHEKTHTTPSESQHALHAEHSDIDFDALHNGTMASCILTPSPRDQKAIGRRARGFNDASWTKASMHVVTAASIARAEADDELRQLYMRATPRQKFVEGSPVDKIWGIGLKWDDPRADDERKWKGGNRLGMCHDMAAAFVREG